MSLAGLTAKLPSGQQMVEDRLPPTVQEQLRAVAQQVLERLFAPIVRLYLARKARLALKHQLFASHASWEAVEAAAFSALQHLSYLGAVTRDLYTLTDSGRPYLGGSLSGSGAAEAQATVTMALPPVDAATGAEIRDKVREMLNSGYVQVAVHLQEEVLEWEWEPASEVLVLVAGAVERRGTAVAVARAAAAAAGGGAGVIGAGASPTGSRRGSVVAGHGQSRRGSTAAGSRPGTSRRDSAGALGSGFSRRTSVGFAPERAAGAPGLAGAVGAPGILNSAVLQVPSTAVGATEPDAERLSAPCVLNELPCVGGFPYCAALSVSSATAVVLRIPKAAYCHMVSECATSSGQRRLLVEALQMRQRLLPYFAPLTRARLQMCPLLTRLRTEQLEHLRDLMIPRVYAAGMECGEREKPTHIFFVRRGVVQMQRVASVSGDGGGGGGREHSNTNSEPTSPVATAPLGHAPTSFSLALPKNRTVLVEGHTYGETSCIFGDSTGDRHTAVTHVDMYLLPFPVLIQLMKQEPEVQSAIYHSAQELSYLRDREWAAVLFGPSLVGTELPGVHGVVPAEGTLALMAAGVHDAVGGIGGFLGGRATAETSFSLDPLSRGSALRGGGGGADRGGTAPTRRVTIFEEASNGGGTVSRGGGGGANVHTAPLTGGRVSTALLGAMEQLPLVGLLPSVTSDFYRDCVPHWQCVQYHKGDVIAAGGEECNRLLLFFEGRAGVVVSAALLQEEMRPGPFGRADVASVSPAVVHHIPAGHVVGYTCVRRHRWTRTILAVDDLVEVWEMRRNAFVQLLRTHGMERDMQAATLQLLQPLAAQKERLTVLDYQPLLRPMPSSLWREQAVPNVHPVVVTNEDAPCFPVWREGDFPLDRRQSVTDATARAGSSGGRRATLTTVSSVKVAAVANERQRSASRMEDSPHLRSRRAGSVTGMSDADSMSRANMNIQLSTTTTTTTT
ncbi:Cyclic nucleotide-binding domain containing protein [Novymonas esmeraldas]|uniref:Cyclic nucleotide-binding domain containing protein n=1 Tax=Novymonas esmeraldas TaxID=1808958 RepID=A0AAW0F5T3_9TRYP